MYSCKYSLKTIGQGALAAAIAPPFLTVIFKGCCANGWCVFCMDL